MIKHVHGLFPNIEYIAYIDSLPTILGILDGTIGKN